jgi:hypothetical protein
VSLPIAGENLDLASLDERRMLSGTRIRKVSSRDVKEVTARSVRKHGWNSQLTITAMPCPEQYTRSSPAPRRWDKDLEAIKDIMAKGDTAWNTACTFSDLGIDMFLIDGAHRHAPLRTHARTYARTRRHTREHDIFLF